MTASAVPGMPMTARAVIRFYKTASDVPDTPKTLRPRSTKTLCLVCPRMPSTAKIVIWDIKDC